MEEKLRRREKKYSDETGLKMRVDVRGREEVGEKAKRDGKN